MVHGAGRGELRLWAMLRPHNWHPTSSQEVLLEPAAERGKEMAREESHGEVE